ncbi:GroES-like protein [Pluteus cervinus]|uniref:GroES-like protein n=1 Tax=Pluteus cervinus TaxID=181527 RepID=A0ACD3B764_9AGAR|nr:GroES-like protein [Pluteus cervinus]
MSPIALPSHEAAVLYGPKDLRVENRTVFPPGYGQVQVAITCTGLCGSDVHYYQHARNGDFAVQAPMVLGHEAAGCITAVGPGVKNLQPGQRVAIEAGIMCKNCTYCAQGRYNLCKGMRFCSSAKTFPHLDGTLQGRMNHPAHVVHPLPDSCSYESAALAEPLGVVIHASRRAQLAAGQTVLVFGVGAIGILACALAKSMDAKRIVAIDLNQARLDFAKANGFCQQTYCTTAADKGKTLDDQLRRSKELTQTILQEFNEPDGFDVVFECTGAEAAIQMSAHAAITGGKVMLIGMGSRNVMLPLSTAATREVDILGSFRYANTYPSALSLLASGKLKNIEKLITHRFPLKDTQRAFDMVSRGQDDDGNMVLKVMIESA